MWSRGWEVILLFCLVKALTMTPGNFDPSSSQWKKSSFILNAELDLESLCQLCKAYDLSQSWTTKSYESLLGFSIWRLSEAHRTFRSSIGRGSSYSCSLVGTDLHLLKMSTDATPLEEYGEREVQFIDPNKT